MKLFRPIRDGKQHVLLVGFPMPERVGGKNVRMHWQPIKLPVLVQGDVIRKGFRPGKESVRYCLDRSNALAGAAELEWLNAENWSQTQLVSRGSVSGTASGAEIPVVN